VDDTPRQFFKVFNVSKGGIVIAHKVIWAKTSSERRRGLLGRSSLNSAEGIYLAPCEWVHTFRMRFPIDVAFISAGGLILAVHHSLKPNRLSKFVLRAEGALELSAGTLRLSDTNAGDFIQLLDAATSQPIFF